MWKNNCCVIVIICKKDGIVVNRFFLIMTNNNVATVLGNKANRPFYCFVYIIQNEVQNQFNHSETLNILRTLFHHLLFQTQSVKLMIHFPHLELN